MKAWRSVKVGDICDLVNGKAFKPEDWSESGIPIIRIQNLNDPRKSFNHWAGSLKSQVPVRTDDVLLAWSGTPGTSFGAHIWKGAAGILNQHIFRVDLDSSKVTKDWWVRSVNSRLMYLIDQAHGGVGLKHVTRPMVDALEIPLPPLPEQRRIAAILDQADALRAKRRAALAQLDEMAQAIFVEMFGDPFSAQNKWKSEKLKNIIAAIDSGWSPICLDRPASRDEWGVLKLGAVTKGIFDQTQQKALPLELLPRASIEIFEGDLLFTRKNTYELVAATSIVTKHDGHLMLSDLIFRLRTNKENIINLYLHSFLSFPSVRKSVQKLAGGSSGSMPNISKSKLLDFEILVPPITLQKVFADRLTFLGGLRKKFINQINEMDSFFASLQHRAFRGEL